MEKLITGLYRAKHQDDNWMNDYDIMVKVKETDNSIILDKIEMLGRYLPAQIEMLLNKDHIVLKKGRNKHTIFRWSNHEFTIYPFQAGIPFYFKLINDIK